MACVVAPNEADVLQYSSVTFFSCLQWNHVKGGCSSDSFYSHFST